MLFEDTVGEAWSAYTDHNHVEVRLAKGWVFRAPPRTPRRIPLSAQVARSALATELDRRVADEQPTTWPEVVSLGLGVARAILGERNLRRILDLPNCELRRCKRRLNAWLRDKEVAWWDAKAQQVQDKAGQGDAFGVFATFKELRHQGSSVALGDVCPKEVQSERDAWAEHFCLIGEGTGSVKDRVWANVPS